MSVGLVLHKDAKLAAKCIQSLVKEKTHFSAFEIIIVDNQSQDDCVQFICQLLREYKTKYKVVSTLSNNLGNARQLAVKHAQHEFLYFTDPDCQLEASGLKGLLRRFFKIQAKDPHVAGVGGANIFTEQTELGELLNRIKAKSPGHFFSAQLRLDPKLRKTSHLSTSNALFFRPALLKSSGFSNNYTFVGEDLDLSYNLIDQGYCLYFSGKSPVAHKEPFSLMGWVKKSYSYGTAQTKVAFYRKSIWKSHRLLPIFSLFLFLAICFYSLSIAAITLAAHTLFSVTYSLSLLQKGDRLKTWAYLFLLCVLTPAAYTLGQLHGALREPFYLLARPIKSARATIEKCKTIVGKKLIGVARRDEIH